MKLWPRVWCLVFLTHGVVFVAGRLMIAGKTQGVK